MGGSREAMANDTHGVDVRKNRVCQNKVKKIEVTWNFGESPPTIVMVLNYIRGCMYQGYDIWKNHKANCTPRLHRTTAPAPPPPEFDHLKSL
jgi:hypothetical protein